MTRAESLLAAVAGYTAATANPSSTNKPARMAVIDPSYTSGWPKVTFEGESTMSGKLYPHLDSYCPAASDRVVMVPVGTTWLIVGAVCDDPLGTGLPAGSIQLFAGPTPPSGWASCDGSAISRTGYARLFAAIGTTWGVGDGSTTFNLPDLQGRVPVGAGAGAGLTARTLATSAGAETHTLSEANLASHTHTGPSHRHTGPSHTHGYDTWQTQQSTTVSPGPNGYTVAADTGTTGSGGTGNTGYAGTGDTGSAGSGTAVGHMPPFAVVTYIIRL